MSHFTVLVIGDNVDKQLEPFSEFECHGEESEHVKEIDITEEAKKSYHEYIDRTTKEGDVVLMFVDFVKWYYDYPILTQLYDPNGESEEGKWGYILKDYHNPSVELPLGSCVVKVIKRTNPNGYWDWYQIGGRWSGFFQLRNGQRVDSALRGEVDIENMRMDASQDAKEYYEKFETVILENPTWIPWVEVLAMDKSIDDKRSFYNEQPAIQAIRNIDADIFFEPDELLSTKEEYIKKAENGALATYAVVHDGKWYSKGEMGWWGVTTKENMAQEEWNAKINELFDSLPGDTKLTIVDCHI